MVVEKLSSLKGVDISANAIASIAGSAAVECYGIVGLSSKKTLGDKVDILLGKKDFQQGITCEKTKKQGYVINIFVVVASDTKITEIALEVQKKVKYVLEKTFSIQFDKVNIYIQGIKKI